MKSGIKVGWLGIAALFVALILAGPVASATADTVVVNSVGDAADQAPGVPCETEAGSCTLRAAIEVADLRPGRDTVTFDPGVFGMGFGGTVEPGSELPAITDPVTIVDHCPPNVYNDIPNRPCAGVDAGGGAAGFRVEADEVAIEGIAVTGAEVGIAVVDSADEFAARRDWVGLDLHEEAGANETGILLRPGSNDAEIGGYDSGGYNGSNMIVDNTAVGLDLEGASRARVTRNEFGINWRTPAPNGIDIGIADVSVGGSLVKAVENEIGGPTPPWWRLQSGCDQWCNVISGATADGIDLQGDGASELPATGPTIIRGNFIGTDAEGKRALPNAHAGIVVGGADNVTIGGPEPKDGNVIAGGSLGVMAGPQAKYLDIEGNFVGRSPEEYGPVGKPSIGGIVVDSSEISPLPEPAAKIVDNEIAMAGGVGIANSGGGASILENSVFGAGTGIWVSGESSSRSGVVAWNFVEFASVNGIRIETSNNHVYGNWVAVSGAAGIRVDDESTFTPWYVTIGPEADGEDASAEELEERENRVEYSGGPAIEVVGGDVRRVDITRNWGGHNAGPFVDLGADGEGNQANGPNAGIQAPVVESATVGGVSGSAEPYVEIRVFAGKTSSHGELDRFLAKTRSNASGKWSLRYGQSLPVGTPVAAAQDADGETSELTFATSGPEATLTGGPGAGAVNHAPEPVCGGASCTPPDTRIVAGARGRWKRPTARFRFYSSVPGSTTQCSLDGLPFRACVSPRSYADLSPGKHLFEVRAVGPTDLVDETPAKRRFTVLK